MEELVHPSSYFSYYLHISSLQNSWVLLSNDTICLL
uniref:Uncharacterized protein n=1 Tax=Anguilla anguilla TaxID=7936 RepID=A0A0E9XSB4_ANGAN